MIYNIQAALTSRRGWYKFSYGVGKTFWVIKNDSELYDEIRAGGITRARAREIVRSIRLDDSVKCMEE